MNRDSEGGSLIDGSGGHSLHAANPGRAIDGVAPDPVPLTGDSNDSALTLGVWSEKSPTGDFDLSSDSSFSLEGWIMIGGDTAPIRIASASNWQLDIKAGENAKSPGSMRLRLGDEPDPIDVLAREIELHSPEPHHFAVVWRHEGTEPGSGMLKLYYDSMEVASQSIPHSKIPASTPTSFQIGDESNPERVALDEVRFSKTAIDVSDFLTGPVEPVAIFQTKFEKAGETINQNGDTLGVMTLFGEKGMTLEALEGRQRFIVKEDWGRADIFSTEPIDMKEIGRKSYLIKWSIGPIGSRDSPSKNQFTRGQHLTLRDGKGLIKQLGDGTPRTFVDFRGISLQFKEEEFKLVADTGNEDGAAVVLTGGTFLATNESFHDGFTAILGVDGAGWTLKIDGIDFRNGKKPAREGTWSEKKLSAGNLFTADMHIGGGCSAAKNHSKFSLKSLSAEIAPIR